MFTGMFVALFLANSATALVPMVQHIVALIHMQWHLIVFKCIDLHTVVLTVMYEQVRMCSLTY